MPSNSFCKPWQDESTLTNSLHHGKHPSTDDKGMQGTSEIGINCKPYKINMKRHGKYSFTKTGDDKLPEVETPKERKQERRDSLDSSCQTPIDWKELTTYDINNLLQDTSTEKSTKTSRKKNSTSLHLIDESRPIQEHIEQTKWKQVTTEEIKDNKQHSERIKWKKVSKESIKGNEEMSNSSERKPSMELKTKTFRMADKERSRNRNDTLDKLKNQISCNDRKNEAAIIKAGSTQPDRRTGIRRHENDNVKIDTTHDNDADDEEDESGNLQTNEETEPSDEEEINQVTSDEKQFQETNNTDESNDDTEAESKEEEGKVFNEDKGDGQVEDERDDEAAEEE